MSEKFREGNVRGGEKVQVFNDGSSKKVIVSQRPSSPPPAPKPAKK
ncbi:hypothetical protein [Pseudomonas frederiksbergensis]|nr:hypothetical protein [Pseudomonas frederiksbergensis]